MSYSSERCTLTQIPETQPLVCITLHPFQIYLNPQQLSWLVVTREANLPCLIVWNIAHSVLVSGAQAMRVRVAVRHLSAMAYTGSVHIHAS
jgi:hypothetical protein